MEREPSEAVFVMMANLILALRDCVSTIREGRHDKIVGEVLGMKLWGSAPVSEESSDLVSGAEFY